MASKGMTTAEVRRRIGQGLVMAGEQSTPPAPSLADLAGSKSTPGQTANGTVTQIGGKWVRMRQNPKTGQPEFLQQGGKNWGPDVQNAEPQEKPSNGALSYISDWAKAAQSGDHLAQGANVYVADGNGGYTVQPSKVTQGGVPYLWDPATGQYQPLAASSDVVKADVGAKNAQAAEANANAAKASGTTASTAAQQNAAAAEANAAADKTRQELLGQLGAGLDQISQMLKQGLVSPDEAQQMRDGLVQSSIRQYQTGMSATDMAREETSRGNTNVTTAKGLFDTFATIGAKASPDAGPTLAGGFLGLLGLMPQIRNDQLGSTPVTPQHLAAINSLMADPKVSFKDAANTVAAGVGGAGTGGSGTPSSPVYDPGVLARLSGEDTTGFFSKLGAGAIGANGTFQPGALVAA